ncbi:MAG TPA: bacteriohemerythrin [Nitrospirota bacterium]|nr:bacteriohemerythrin [Nitrospirota bacterium]
MEWNKTLEVGIDTIDSQHRELFRRINRLVLAIREHRCKSEIDGVLKFLDDYARVHFADEAKHMRETGYPGYEEQLREHQKYLAALKELKEQAEQPRISGASYDLSATTNQVVVDWIVDHIMKVDMRFGEFLRNKKAHDV